MLIGALASSPTTAPPFSRYLARQLALLLCPVSVTIVDSSSIAINGSGCRNVIVLGTPATDSAVEPLARACGASMHTRDDAVATARARAHARTMNVDKPKPEAPEGYRLFVVPSDLYSFVGVVGADAPGTFFGAVSLVALLNRSSAAAEPVPGPPGQHHTGIKGITAPTLPGWEITDAPDMPLRGYEVEMSMTVSVEDWYKVVANAMARLKMNWVLWDIGMPFE